MRILNFKQTRRSHNGFTFYASKADKYLYTIKKLSKCDSGRCRTCYQLRIIDYFNTNWSNKLVSDSRHFDLIEAAETAQIFENYYG